MNPFNYQCITSSLTTHVPMDYAYIAKGLYQKYMIERNDFSKLNETYQSGKNVLDYVNILSDKERILLYYGLSVHAYSQSYVLS